MGRTGRGLSLSFVYSLPPYSFLRAPLDYSKEYSPGTPPPNLPRHESIRGWTRVDSDIFQPYISGTNWVWDALGFC